MNIIKESSIFFNVEIFIFAIIILFLYLFSFIKIESKKFDKTSKIIRILIQSNKKFNEEINKLIKSDLNNKANEILLNLKSFVFTIFKYYAVYIV